jgi:hypothetical protein
VVERHGEASALKQYEFGDAFPDLVAWLYEIDSKTLFASAAHCVYDEVKYGRFARR